MKNTIVISNPKGFSLIEILVVLGIIGIVLATTITLVSNTNKESTRLSVLTILQNLRDRNYKLIETHESYLKTIDSTAALSCLHTGSTTNCTETDPPTTPAIDLPIYYNSAGTAVYDSSTNGFKWDGTTCTLASGNVNCPITWETLVYFDCGTAATSCLRPAVTIIAKLVLRDNPNNFPINLERFSFTVFKGGSLTGSSVTRPTFSQDCSDWSTRGWNDKADCMQDGRWHKVFENNSSGTILFGSVNELRTAIQSAPAVQVKCGVQTEQCALAYESISVPGTFYCLTGLRFSGEAPAFYNLGAARYSSGGQVTCLNQTNPTVDACPGMTIGCSWLVRH